jgi:hypothetical protein
MEPSSATKYLLNMQMHQAGAISLHTDYIVNSIALISL